MSEQSLQNDIDTKEQTSSSKHEMFWNIFSIISAILYSVFIFIGLDYQGLKTFAVVIICFEVLYVISLVLLIILSKDKAKLGLRLKNYKSAVKILKALATIICLILSISVIIKSATTFDLNNFFDICYKIFMIAFSVISAIVSICTIIFRKKIETTKSVFVQKLKENWQDTKIKR